jgi:hypothetical protein
LYSEAVDWSLGTWSWIPRDTTLLTECDTAPPSGCPERVLGGQYRLAGPGSVVEVDGMQSRRGCEWCQAGCGVVVCMEG